MKNIKKITCLLLILTTFSCSETDPTFEKWGGTMLTEVEDSVLDNYFDARLGATIYGIPIEVNEFYKGKICVQKESKKGVIYPSDIENIMLDPVDGAVMTITLNADIPYDEVVSKDPITGITTINMFDIITKYGYNDWGSTLGTISFQVIGNDSYDLVI